MVGMGTPPARDQYDTVDEAALPAPDTDPDVRSPAVVVVQTERHVDLPPGSPIDTEQLPRGAAIGRYLVLSRLGAGGMGVVYAAYDPDLDRKVAIKLLRSRQMTAKGNTAGRMRFLREAQALARLSHPNVTAVYDVGTAYNQVFVAMEFIDGCTLRDWLYVKRPSLPEILGIFRRAGQGLLAAHQAGMVHRDFKPDNVLVGSDGQVRVSDFGLARALHDPGERPENKVTPAKATPAKATPKTPTLAKSTPARVSLTKSAPTKVSLPKSTPANISREPSQEPHQDGSGEQALHVPITQVGELLGTPRYMAPEQFRGDSTDQRTDLFSFCVALWEAVYGVHPFSEGSSQDIQELCLATTLGKLVPPPGDRKIPAWLHRILLRGLAPEPADRYPSMAELLHELSRDRRRRQLRVATAALGVALVALGGWGVNTLLQRNQLLCRAAALRLGGVWNGEVRSVLRSALLATGHPQAEATAQRVLSELDNYTAQWAAMRVEACVATHVRGEQSAELLDLRMQCLDRRLQEVEALTQELRTVDRQTIERVVHARYDFTPTAVCADAAALRVPVPLPERPEVRAQVEALYREMAVLKAQDFSGRYSEMAPRARTALATAHTIGYGPAEAQAAFILGKVEFRNGDIAGAQRDFERAAALSLSSGNSSVLANSLVLIHHIVGISRRQYDQAPVWQELAASAIARSAEAARTRPQLLSDSCVVASSRKRYSEAVQLCQQAIALQAQLTGEQSPEAAAYMNNLASVYRHSGQTAEALQEYQRALQILVQHSGRQHPLATMTLRNWASLLFDTGQIQEAAGRYNEALTLIEQRFGRDDPRLLDALSTVVLAERRLHNLPRARASAERMLAIARKTFGEQHEKTAAAHEALAQVLYEQERFAESLAQHEAARPLLEQAHDDGPLADNLIGSANCLRALARPAEALPLLERALQLLKSGADNSLIPDGQFALAQTLWAMGKRKQQPRALTAAQVARSGYEQLGPPARDQLAAVSAWIAEHDAK